MSNMQLGKVPLGTLEQSRAEWLWADEVLNLVHMNNPDGANTSPGWMNAPGAIDNFETFYARTFADPAEHGHVHIMIVNTDTSDGGGRHWFLAAWYIDPIPTDMGGAASSAASAPITPHPP